MPVFDFSDTPKKEEEPQCTYTVYYLSLIHISEPTRQAEISYAVFCLKKKKIQDRGHLQPKRANYGNNNH